MLTTFSSRAWYEYTRCQLEDKKIRKRINALIRDIERNGNTGIEKPEPLKNFILGRILPNGGKRVNANPLSAQIQTFGEPPSTGVP